MTTEKPTRNIWTLLRERFAAPTFAFLEEVRNGTGFQRHVTRTADALACCTWPSRGLELHGIEVKTSRPDWLRERNDPAKSAEIQRFCDRWWLASDDDTIVLDGEVPPTWGLLVRCGAKLVCKIDAPKLDAVPLDRLMLASILRNVAAHYVPRASIAGDIESARTAACEAEHARGKAQIEGVERERDQLRRAVREFENAAGVDLGVHRTWDNHARKVGEAVNFIVAGRTKDFRRDLDKMLVTARAVLASLEMAIGGLDVTDCDNRNDGRPSGLALEG